MIVMSEQGGRNITPGRHYQAHDHGDGSFTIPKNDAGLSMYCRIEGCAHIHGDWVVVENDDNHAIGNTTNG